VAARADAPDEVPVPGAAASAVAAGGEAPADAVVERCRALWRIGDWPALVGYAAGDIERHPQRGSLALMVATAHQALGQTDLTRRFVALARQWGCTPQQIARALIAGVHNTLGRACVAAGKQRQHALRHFADALAPGGDAGSGVLTLQRRVRQQLGEMQLDGDAASLFDGPTESAPAAPRSSPSAPEPYEALRRSNQLMMNRLKEQGQQLGSVRRAVEGTVRKEMANAVRQLEAHANLRRYLDDGKLTPALHGWPVSPDLAMLLIDMIESNDYDLVIEFGSGTSTLLMAIALARAAQRRQRRAPAVQVAFEHLEAFHRQTLGLLQRMDLARCVQLELAPLQPWTSAQGETYAFYACQDKLLDILHALPGPAARALVLVDGPPAATGAQARYPALPIVLPLLRGVAMDVLLDDHARPEEQQVSKMWLADLEAAGRQASMSTPELEKGACVLEVAAA
jgi:hypothetical protein